MDGSSEPETKVRHGTAINACLHCFVRLIDLPIRSILSVSLLLCGKMTLFFSGVAPDDRDSARFLELVLNFGRFPFPSLFLTSRR